MNAHFRHNELRVGENLALLRDRSIFPDESVDLVYLDPPRQPHRGSHAAAKEVPATLEESAMPANNNIWQWDSGAAAQYNEIIQDGTPKLRAVIAALQVMLGHSAMFAYLVHMTVRLREVHRVVKKTGSVFLHCDPIVSHYLKILMDALFGQKSLVNEIVWKRVSSHVEGAPSGNHMVRSHDIILFYRKSEKGTFHVPMVVGSDDYVNHFFPHTDYRTGRRYRLGDVTTTKQPPHPQYTWRIKRSGEQGRWMGDIDEDYRRPEPGWEYKVVEPFKGRFWGLPREIMVQAETEGMLVYSRVGYPHVKRFMPGGGVPVQDIWTDIPPLTGSDRIFATQKPRALLERIVQMASDPGDVILDPFSGSGTTLEAVEIINRQNSDEPARLWIGIEASSLGVNLTKSRLGRFSHPAAHYRVVGDIRDLGRAENFAARHPLEFQYWALGMIGARPRGAEKVRSAPGRLIDGVRLFREKTSPKPSTILAQAKPANVKQEDVRQLQEAIARNKAPMGILISLQDPTREAVQEAFQAGFYECAATGKRYPRIQIATVEELIRSARRQEPACLVLPPRHPGEFFK